MNKVILEGRLGRDPEVKFTSGDAQLKSAGRVILSGQKEKSNMTNGQALIYFALCISKKTNGPNHNGEG